MPENTEESCKPETVSEISRLLFTWHQDAMENNTGISPSNTFFIRRDLLM